MPGRVTDEEWIERFLDYKDGSALQHLVYQYREAMLGVYVAMTNLDDPILRQLGRFRPADFFDELFKDISKTLVSCSDAQREARENFALWLWRFILGKCSKVFPSEWALDVLHLLLKGGVSIPKDIKEAACIQALVKLGKTHPSPPYQKTIVLKLFAKKWDVGGNKLRDLTFEEIGRILANPHPIKTDTVKSWYHRGMEELGKILKGDHYAI